MELLIGCGASREKRIGVAGEAGWKHLVTLDIDPEKGPDVVHDLNVLPLPLDENRFDEIHAYEVLEHVGKQGDWRFFFAQFDDFWRVLKPNGLFFATVPAADSVWAWGDPGHTRIVSRAALTFLCRKFYNQVGITSMTDYRPYFVGDWDLLSSETANGEHRFVLKAIK